MKKLKGNCISKTCFILSFRRFVANILYDPADFEKNVFFTKSAVVHNCYIAIPTWNLFLNSKSNKIGKGLTFLYHVLFCLSNVSLQRYDSAQFWAEFENKAFSHSRMLYTVTQHWCGGEDRVWTSIDGWDGQGLKNSCFFGNFSRITKS